MKTKLLSLFCFCIGLIYHAQITKPVREFDVDKTKVMKLSKKFNFKTSAEINQIGNIKTKWIPFVGVDKDIKVKEKGVSNKKEQVGGTICNTITKTLDVSSGSFMNSSADLQVSSIYPGAIYPADDFLKGNYNRAVKSNRLPIYLKGSDNSFGSARLINNPNDVTIDDERKRLINSVKDKSKSKNLETKFRIFYSSNEDISKFLLSAGASGYGVKVNAKAGTKSSSNKVTLTFDAYKSVYSLDASSKGDNEFFTALPANISADNLVIVDKVAYGCRILANITVECHSSEAAFALSSSYSGYGFTAGLNIDMLNASTSKNVTINYKQVGGGNLEGTITTDVENMQSNIIKILNNTNYDNAVPISYSLRDLEGNNMGIQSTVDNYRETICFTNQFLDKVFVNIGSGKDGKNGDNFLHLKLYDDNNNLIAYYDQPKSDGGFKKSDWSGTIPLKLVRYNDGGTATTSQFTNGGKLHIYADHKGGKDDWYIDEVDLLIYLADGSVLKNNESNSINWKMIAGSGKSIKLLTKEDDKLDLYFDKMLKGFCGKCAK